MLSQQNVISIQSTESVVGQWFQEITKSLLHWPLHLLSQFLPVFVQEHVHRIPYRKKMFKNLIKKFFLFGNYGESNIMLIFYKINEPMTTGRIIFYPFTNDVKFSYIIALLIIISPDKIMCVYNFTLHMHTISFVCVLIY